jgi:oligoendopeptidase F
MLGPRATILPMTDVDTVAWNLDPLLDSRTIDEWFAQAEVDVVFIESHRGRVASLDTNALAALMQANNRLSDHIGRAANFASLRFAVDTNDAVIGAEMQRVSERATELGNRLVFVDLEWAQVDDATAAALLADEQLEFCRHYLEGVRRFRPHLLSEAEERLDADRAQSGRGAWVRLFNEQISAITVAIDDRDVSLEQGLSTMQSHDRNVRQAAQQAVTDALQPGLRTRAYIYNTLMLDRSISDRHRNYDTWISAWNLGNEAGDASVEALVQAVVARYDLVRRWYRLKAQLLGVDQLADYDRYAAVSADEAPIGWGEGVAIVRDAYASFSDELAGVVGRFVDEAWIDAPQRPGKRPGAFCAYTVADHHPYVLLNWTDRTSDVLTLAHELGHGVHGYLARGQGNFHQGTPLTVAETASVFGETVTFNRLLDQTSDPAARLGLLAHQVEGAVATIFRQTAMNRFEDAAHNARRSEGELSVDRLGDLWQATQRDMFGDAVEITDNYRSWWSYIPHFIGTPGYVYSYAFGQLLALSVYQRYVEEGPSLVPRYLDMLRAGGSRSPEALAAMVGCNLADPGFWDGGLAIVEAQIDAAEQAATDAGRL